MSLPSKEVFLAASLTPLPSREGEIDCRICLQPMRLPVQTPCKHIFCARYLAAWFKTSSDCPHDRRKLFDDRKTSTADLMSRPNEQLLQVAAWRQSLEPFTFADSSIGSLVLESNDDIDRLSDVDLDIRRAVVRFIRHFDEWIRERSGRMEHLQYRDVSYEIEADPTILRVIAFAGCLRMASKPGDNRRTHDMCRYEWTQIYRRISQRLVHKTIRPNTVGQLQSILNSLLEPQKYEMSAEGIDVCIPGLVLNREVHRFGEDVRRLIRWITSAAADMWTHHISGDKLEYTPEVASRMLEFASEICP